MANFNSYPLKDFSAIQKFIANENTGQVVRVSGQDILDASLDALKKSGDVVNSIDTLTEAIAGDYLSGIYLLVGGGTVTLDGDQAIYRVSDAGSGGIVMANGNELVLLFVANTPENIVTPIASVASLFGLTGVAGQQISVGEYVAGTSDGGGPMDYDATLARTNHTGGLIFSPARDLDSEGIEAYRTTVIDADLGCWVRRTDGLLDFTWFGLTLFEFFVSAAGNDSSNGLAASAPFLTIQKAIDTYATFRRDIGTDCTINLAAGTYTEGGVVDGIQSDAEIIFSGDTAANTIIDGSGAANTSGLNFNNQVSGRARNLTCQNFSFGGVVFQNNCYGVIDTCNATDNGSAGFNASSGTQLLILGVCTVKVPTGGQGVRYYQNCQGSISDGTNLITIDGQGNTATGLVVRNSSTVVCDDNMIIDDFGVNGALIYRSSFIEFRTTTISNCGVGILARELSIYVDAGVLLSGPGSPDITFTANTKNLDISGWSHRTTDPVNTAIGADGPTGLTRSSNYDIVLDNEGATGIQILTNGNTANLDFDKLGRISHVASDNTMRITANSVEVVRLRSAPASNTSAMQLLINDGSTTTLRVVEVGAADSGGTGQRLLTVDN